LLLDELDGGGELGHIRNNNRWKKKAHESARFWLETNSVNLDSCSLQVDDRPALHQNKDGIGTTKDEREYGMCAFTLAHEGIAMIDENKEKKIVRENKR
jgi:hypothetical protein